MAFYLTFFPLLGTADALTMANARISSLEAELEASKKAWDAATAANIAAEKAQQQPRRRKLRRHLLMLIRGVFKGNKP
jgi:hypothetical protein